MRYKRPEVSMSDLFLAFAYHDDAFARGLADDLAERGLTVGGSVSLWPGMRLLPRLDSGLHLARFAVVVISDDFLKFSWPRKELDGIATRRHVVPLLHGIDEAEVCPHSPRLAVAAFSADLTERLVNLLRGVDCRECDGVEAEADSDGLKVEACRVERHASSSRGCTYASGVLRPPASCERIYDAGKRPRLGLRRRASSGSPAPARRRRPPGSCRARQHWCSFPGRSVGCRKGSPP